MCQSPLARGHTDVSSRSVNPAATLVTASDRVTLLAPNRPTSRLPILAAKSLRGSQATNAFEHEAIAGISTPSASVSK